MRHHTIAVLLCLLPGLSICGPNVVADRKAYWGKIVSAEVPVGTSEANLISWARGRSLDIVTGAAPTTRVIGLEYVPVSSSICKGFGISLEVTIAPAGTISKEVVRSLGNCV
jgi:hypothetical protein